MGAVASGFTHRAAKTVHAVLCNTMGSGGIAYIVREVLDNMPGPLLRPRLWYPQGDLELRADYHRPVFNRLLWRALWKARVPETWQARAVLEIALRDIRPGDVLYAWPPFDSRLMRRAKARGAVLVAERVNCMGYTCKTLLEPAFARLDLPMPDGWCAPKAMAEEQDQMAMCDWVTAPSDLVAQSLIDAGIPRDRILETSYGWSPRRLASAVGIERPARPPVFLFVGQGIVRKGLNLLLEAWEKAAVHGKLVIAGRVEDVIQRACARQLARPDVELFGYRGDVASAYAAADVFVFPTHEEGCPLVANEAAACGLPSIVSPMGAGRVIRNDREGIVLDPYDIDGWVEAIRRMATDEVLRARMGAAAALHARQFTWQRLGGLVYEHLVAATSGNQPRTWAMVQS